MSEADQNPLALPYEPHNDVQTVDYSNCFKLDQLGPMIINTDGSIQRVSNWNELTQEEQDRTFRLICARNQKRLAILKAQAEIPENACDSTTDDA